MSIAPEAVLAVCRFVHDSVALLLWGASAYLWALVPADLAGRVGRRLARSRRIAVGLALATSIAALPLDAAAIGGGWPDALDPATLRAILFQTSVGSALMAQLAAALALTATLAVPARWLAGATAVASGLLLATLSLTGHAAMHEGTLGLAHRLNDIAHVLAGGAWLGALVPLLLLLQALSDRACARDAGIALRRFSLAGHVAVALVVTTGILNTALVLGRWPTDWSSPYQAMLCAKIVVVAIMIGLAVLNRYLLVPRMARSRESAIQALRRGTLAELVLGLVVVALVSVFGLLEPA